MRFTIASRRSSAPLIWLESFVPVNSIHGIFTLLNACFVLPFAGPLGLMIKTAGTSCTRRRKSLNPAATFNAARRWATGTSFQTLSSLPGCCRKTAIYPRAAQCLPRNAEPSRLPPSPWLKWVVVGSRSRRTNDSRRADQDQQHQRECSTHFVPSRNDKCELLLERLTG